MRAVLDGRGWRVEVAAGGRAALERLKTTRYDLVIADLRMPELDGPDFYHAAVAQRHELADRFLSSPALARTPRRRGSSRERTYGCSPGRSRRRACCTRWR